MQRGQGISRRLSDEIVESFVLVDVNHVGAVLAQHGGSGFGPGAEHNRIDIAQLARLCHQLECRRLQLACVQLRVYPNLRH